jgi:hypothetical protein
VPKSWFVGGILAVVGAVAWPTAFVAWPAALICLIVAVVLLTRQRRLRGESSSTNSSRSTWL